MNVLIMIIPVGDDSPPLPRTGSIHGAYYAASMCVTINGFDEKTNLANCNVPKNRYTGYSSKPEKRTVSQVMQAISEHVTTVLKQEDTT